MVEKLWRRGAVIVARVVVASLAGTSLASEWNRYPVPCGAGPGREWRLQEDVSDDFTYEFQSTPDGATLGGKWVNRFINPWKGPGSTEWRHENVSVRDGRLRIWATRVDGETKSFRFDKDADGAPELLELPATRLGCVSSVGDVVFPAFLEARVKIANAVLASNVWLLSADSTQEIDLLESYGGPGDDGRSDWFARRIHLSHHVFIRRPLQDYQPKDDTTWYLRKDVNSKDGEGYWTADFHRIGVYWRDATHLEYYIDGELVKTTSGLDDTDGRGGIDPRGYTRDASGRRTGLTKPMRVIVNMEAQNWNAAAGRQPTDEEIERRDDHTFLVDWIRVYKPVEIGAGS